MFREWRAARVEEEVTRLPDEGLEVKGRPPVSMADIIKDGIPDKCFHREKKLYVEGFHKLFTVFSVLRDGSEAAEYVQVGPTFDAHQVNAVMHHAAPNPAFGLTTDDVLGDWEELATGTTEKVKNLRTAHGTMPGWDHFLRERDRIYDLLKRNYGGSFRGFDEQDSNDTLTSVLRFAREGEGMKIILDEPDEALVRTLGEALPEEINDPNRLSSTMGLLFLASYATDNAQWPRQSSYHSDTTGRQNLMITTQSPALAYRETVKAQNGDNIPERDLQQSPLLFALADYADTGGVQPVKIDGISERKLLKEPGDPFLNHRIVDVIGNALMIGGVTSAVYGAGAGIIADNARDALDEKYAAIEPVPAVVERARGAHDVLVDLQADHPETAPLIASEIDEQQTIFRADIEKQAAEDHEYAELSGDVSFYTNVFIGGTVGGIGGFIARRKYGS